MQAPTENADAHRHKGSYVAAIMLLMIVVAIFLAAARNLLDNPMEDATQKRFLGFWLLSGAVLGILVGIFVGFAQPRPVRGTLLGIFIGILTGMAGAVLFTHPKNLPLVAVGSLVLVLFGVVVRAFSRRTPLR